MEAIIIVGEVKMSLWHLRGQFVYKLETKVITK